MTACVVLAIVFLFESRKWPTIILQGLPIYIKRKKKNQIQKSKCWKNVGTISLQIGEGALWRRLFGSNRIQCRLIYSINPLKYHAADTWCPDVPTIQTWLEKIFVSTARSKRYKIDPSHPNATSETPYHYPSSFGAHIKSDMVTYLKTYYCFYVTVANGVKMWTEMLALVKT